MKAALQMPDGMNQSQNLTKLGEILMREGQDKDLVDAATYLKRAIELDESAGQPNSDTVVCLGRTLEKQNKIQEAMVQYEKAIADPNRTQVNAYFYLGVLYEK